MEYKITGYMKKADFATFLNIFFGFMAIVYMLDGNLQIASKMIILAIIADGFDGYWARKTKTDSEFGMNFDSLSDSLSFGVAPALMLYIYVGNYWIVPISILYLISGILRLARYNVTSREIPQGSFVGMPIPLGAFIVVLSIFGELNIFLAAFLTFASSLLMVSTIGFNKSKRVGGFPIQNLALLLFVAIPAAYIEVISRITLAAYVGSLIYSKKKN